MFNWYGVSIWEDEKFQRWMMVIVTQQCDVFNATELHT